MLSEVVGGQVFKLVHGNSLVYNCCWEDPRIDRAALQLSSSDVVVMITSAGCNALDYAIAGAGQIHAVDMNYRQNALLELKMAGIRRLNFEDFFSMFGSGRLTVFPRLYQMSLRKDLSPIAQSYWDKRLKYFSGSGWCKSFYFRGTSGLFARTIKTYIDVKPGIRQALNELFDSKSLEEQSEIYRDLKPRFWTKFIRWLLGRDTTMAMLGVPRAQRLHVEKNYPGGIAKFIEDCVESVFAHMPLQDNYFWRLYTFGEYKPDCCPEYLTETGFHQLKNGAVNAVRTYTNTITDFLSQLEGKISRFVLLDHMDWLNTPKRLNLLAAEWQAIVNRASSDARVIWRSGGLDGRFVDSIQVMVDGVKRQVGELLCYFPEHASELHSRDRVHTYGSFCIADLSTRA
jgi:S-adenosylmethionine-diacylglycerol 3-amino-3-carboxypropyl transferase